MELTFLGGDARQRYAAGRLRECGMTVHESGLDGGAFTPSPPCDMLVLPMPASRTAGRINAPLCAGTVTYDMALTCCRSGGTVLAGMPDGELSNACARRGLKLRDYSTMEVIAASGAVSTAEAAIADIIYNTKSTVAGSRILMTGGGRIARYCAELLHAMGAQVRVSARSPAQRAYFKSRGIEAADISDLRELLADCVCVINTVPARILTEERLKYVSSDCRILDLASDPGGADAETARKLNLQYVRALGLPGKTAPAAAGAAVADAVREIIMDEWGTGL